MTARIQSGRLSLFATAACLPGEPVSSSQLLAKIHQNFGIKSIKGKALARVLGIETRHIARDLEKQFESPRIGSRNPDIAANALDQVLKSAKIDVEKLQYIVAHTTTPAKLIPPNVAEVAKKLSFQGPVVELRQACTGFANALQLVFGLLTNSDSDPVAIVGSEVGSVYFDPLQLRDKSSQWVNLMQMGDGAGAILLGPYNQLKSTNEAYLTQLYYGKLAGDHMPGFTLDGGSDFPGHPANQSSLNFNHDYESVKLTGGDLFRAGVATIISAGYRIEDFKFIIPHQVSGHIGSLLAHELGVPEDRFFVNARQVGNLGSAAIWVALHQLRTSGLLAYGDQVLILGAEATHHMYGGFVYVHGPLANLNAVS
jgi:3-oxoacyl-[acyl-carrier-protein] synthase III